MWTGGGSLKKLLENIKKNTGQTHEARDHASLIFCSIEMFEKQNLAATATVSAAAFSCQSSADEQDSAEKQQQQQEGEQKQEQGEPEPEEEEQWGPRARAEAEAQEAAEYMHLLRSTSRGIADPVAYDTRPLPELNAEPFFRFHIVGVTKRRGSGDTMPSGVTEV
jgi:hypothetical protein